MSSVRGVVRERPEARRKGRSEFAPRCALRFQIWAIICAAGPIVMTRGLPATAYRWHVLLPKSEP